MNRRLKYLFWIIISAIIIIYTLYSSFHFDNIFQWFIYIPFGILFLMGLWKLIFIENELYKKTNEIKVFSATLTGFFFLSLILGISMYYLSKENSPSFLKAENHGVYADFKRNGTYIIKSGSWATKTHFYGKYIMKDSLIILDRVHLDDVIFNDKFLIKNGNLFLLSKSGEKLYDFEITYFKK